MSAAPSNPRADANVVAFANWFLPGAGFLWMGELRLALVCAAVVQGVFFLGGTLSQWQLFELLQPDLRMAAAPALTPEVGNLAGILWQYNVHGFGPGAPRPWAEHVHLGIWLTAISGFLNVCFTVHAHFLAQLPRGARSPERSPGLLVLAAWLVPGLGHWLQGRRARAAVVFALLVGMLVLSAVLAQGSNLDRERHFFYWAGHFLVGAPMMLVEAIHGHARVVGEIAYADAGLCFGAVAGLLNVLAMLDVVGVAEPKAVAAAAAANPPAGAVA